MNGASAVDDRGRQQRLPDDCVTQREAGINSPTKVVRSALRREDGNYSLFGKKPLQRPDGGAEVAVGRDQERGVETALDAIFEQGDRDAHIRLLLLISSPLVPAAVAGDVLLLEPAKNDVDRGGGSQHSQVRRLSPLGRRVVSHRGGEVTNQSQLLILSQEPSCEGLEI